MPNKTVSRKTKERNDERLFFFVVIVVTSLVGSGFFYLLFALGQSEKNAQSVLPKPATATAIAPDRPRQLVDFTLTNCTGRVVTQAELQGKILVVDFLLTSCGLTCPVVNGHMAQIQQMTTNQPDVKLVSLTVDPRDDTPDVLLEFSKRFNADTNRWLFLSGDKSELYRLIGASFLGQDTNDIYTYMPGDFADTERIAVVDSQGHVRAYYDGLADDVASAVVKQINQLRN